MAFTFPAMVAWDPNGKQTVKNVSFQVYATSDTAYSTPLAITDPFGNPLPGNILNSGSQGVFPQFQQASNATVVIADSTKTYAWTVVSVSSDAATASFINTPTSATAGALNATYDRVVTATGLVGGTDCTSALQGSFTSAQTKGLPLVIPAAANGLPYKVSAILYAWTGARIHARGAVLDFQTDHSATGRGLFIGTSGSGISDVQVFGLKVISSNASARNGVYGLISVFDSTDVLLQECWVGNSLANSGGEGGGVYTQNTTDFRYVRLRVQNSMADGIHTSRGSLRGVIDHPVVIGAQDDGIAVTSVKQDGAGPIYGPCQYVDIIAPTVRNSTVLGSGIALVGAQDCSIIGGEVDTVPASGLVVLQANYGGIINPARNRIVGLGITNAASTSSAVRIGNADRTVISGIDISQSPGGIVVLSSTRTKISGSGISSTADQFGIYDDGASSRTLVTGCDLSANGAQSYNVYYGTAPGAENKLAGTVQMGTTSLTITATPTAAGAVPASNTSGLTVPTANTPTTAATGGTIPAATHYFKVTAVNSKGETTGSNEVTVTTTGTNSTITVTWGAIIDAFLLQGAGSVQTANITA